LDPVPHENDPYKYIHNSVVHDIDTAAWLAYPFEKCAVNSVEFDKDQTLTIELSFAKKSSSGVYDLPVTITFAKGNQTYLNRVEVTTSTTHKTFEEDYSGKVFFDRYRPAYIRAWQNFHKEINARKTNGNANVADESEYSLVHPSFAATYQLLDDALKICREKVRPVQ
jgi:outer membrane translocation and assembly module TamA